MSHTEIVDSYSFKKLNFLLLKAISDGAQHPKTTIRAPGGWLVLGGGAFVDWIGPLAPIPPGNLLTGMYPNKSGTTWTVSSKDHLVQSNARIIAFCVVAQMKDGTSISENDYGIAVGT